MTIYKGLPIYWLDLGGDTTGIDIISLVDCPAIEKDFVKFSKDVEVKFSVDDEKRIVFGAALIPDKPIYRRNDDGKEFYVKFSKDAIERIAIKFFEDHNSTNVNLQHEYDVDGCVYFESFIKDSKRGLVPANFEDCPEGTWFLGCKINNPEVWRLVKEGVLRGFSVEGNLAVMYAEEKPLETIQDLLDYLKDNS